MPHFLPLYIDCLIDRRFLSSSCHYLMLSSSCHYVVIIRYVYLIIPQDVLIYGVRVFILTLLLPLPLPITYAWHYFIEYSPPYHSALPAIFVTRRYPTLPAHIYSLVPFLSQMISSSDLYRHYRDTISTRPSTR